MVRKSLYSIEKLFWSIYFALSIAIIGLIMGYLVTCFLFMSSILLGYVSIYVSVKVRRLAEYLQCYSIWFLLRIQPWYRCKDNFQSIFSMYKIYKTRRVMFVANHRSNLDTFILISLIPGLRGLAKRSLFLNPFIAPFMFMAGFVPVKKGDTAEFIQGLHLLQTQILEKNNPVLVFPETTRCFKNFNGVGKFSDSVFKAAIDSKSLIVPILMNGTDKVLGRGDFLLNPYHQITVSQCEIIDATQFKDQHSLSLNIHNILTKKLLCS